MYGNNIENSGLDDGSEWMIDLIKDIFMYCSSIICFMFRVFLLGINFFVYFS